MKESVKYYLFKYLDTIKSPVELSGWQIQSSLFPITGKHTYPSTLLEYAREYSDITGSKFKCLNNKTSEYLFERGFKLENAFCDK